MKIWIVWLPNVGKSTLFNALTKSYAADAANFPFCTIEPNVGIVDVKDPRMVSLSELSGSKKRIFANITFVDIAWLVRGASKGEWMGNAFLSHIREVDAVVQVLRYFKDTDINHVEWEVDPMRDVEIINMELMFSDMEQIERKLPQLKRKAKGRDADVLKEIEALEKAYKVLEWGQLLCSAFDPEDKDFVYVRPYNFLTIKPFVYVLNVGEDDLDSCEKIKKEYEEKLNASVAIVCAKLESDMMEMDDEERELLLEDYGDVPTLDDLISLAFDTVGLMYYFTTGEKETRAWTVKKGSTAPQAAAAIHTDFERWFIKAEIVSCVDLLEAGSRNAAKTAWQLRLEWKTYIVQDGDVIHFKFNV